MAMFIVKPWYRKQDDAIYGAEWAGTSDPSWTRTDAAVGFANPNPYYAGMSTTPSSPFDNIMPWSGMRRVTDASAGELVEMPKFYYKLSQPNGVGLKVQISMSQFNGSSVDPMHMDRGDGIGERDYAYIGRYHCSTNDYKSTTGVKPKLAIRRSNARTAIHNLGINIWQYSFAESFTLWLLYIVEYANWNSQSCIGYGCGNENVGVENTGSTDTMPYHTGTMKSNRTTYGVGIQYRYIEDWWANIFDWKDGCYQNSNGLYIILNPNSYSDTTNGVFVGKPSSGYPSAISVNNTSGAFPLYIPTQSSGSENTYLCDYWSYTTNKTCLYGSGAYYNTQGYGAGCNGVELASYAGPDVGCRLTVLPPSRLNA